MEEASAVAVLISRFQNNLIPCWICMCGGKNSTEMVKGSQVVDGMGTEVLTVNIELLVLVVGGGMARHLGTEL